MIFTNAKLIPLLVIVSLVISAAPAYAEMQIKLKNGQVLEVPVSKEEIESIEYKDSEPSPEEKVFPEDSIRIRSAKYGNVSFELGNELGYKQYFCDAAPELVKRCNGKGLCRIIVGSNICGDPYPGRGKYLYVEYTCGGRLKRAKNTQTEVMRLKCP